MSAGGAQSYFLVTEQCVDKWLYILDRSYLITHTCPYSLYLASQVFVGTNLYVHTIIAHFFQYRPLHQNGECWSLRLVKNILLVGDFYAKRWYYKLTYCLDTVSTYVYISTVPPIYICMGFILLIWWQISSTRTYWLPLIPVQPFRKCHVTAL